MKALLKALFVFLLIVSVGYGAGWIASSQGFNPQQFSIVGKTLFIITTIFAVWIGTLTYIIDKE